MIKQLILASLLIGCFAVFPQDARACFCITPPLAESLQDSRSVFLGEAIEIVQPKTSDENVPITDRAATVTFRILQSWKGVPLGAEKFKVLWLAGCYECLELPVLHNEYLVFGSPLSGSTTWSVITMCNRTTLVTSKSLVDPNVIAPYRDRKQLKVHRENYE